MTEHGPDEISKTSFLKEIAPINTHTYYYLKAALRLLAFQYLASVISDLQTGLVLVVGLA